MYAICPPPECYFTIHRYDGKCRSKSALKKLFFSRQKYICIALLKFKYYYTESKSLLHTNKHRYFHSWHNLSTQQEHIFQQKKEKCLLQILNSLFLHVHHSLSQHIIMRALKVRYSRKNIGIISIAQKMCCVLS